jgi:hypothetical protein
MSSFRTDGTHVAAGTGPELNDRSAAACSPSWLAIGTYRLARTSCREAQTNGRSQAGLLTTSPFRDDRPRLHSLPRSRCMITPASGTVETKPSSARWPVSHSPVG